MHRFPQTNFPFLYDCVSRSYSLSNGHRMMTVGKEGASGRVGRGGLEGGRGEVIERRGRGGSWPQAEWV